MSEGRSVALLMGTRPEALKLAPLAQHLTAHVESRIVDTGQHPGLVDEALHPFELRPDRVLATHRSDGSLATLAAALTKAVDAELTRRRPAAVVVQGDTLTAFIGGLVAFWQRLPVVHLEAGLRSHDLAGPFPEEANRSMLARLATLHLAPTPAAAENLRNEGIAAGRIVLTGNTVVDALDYLLTNGLAVAPSWVDSRRPLIVVTIHRRENWGDGVTGVCTALRRLARAMPRAQIVMVVHPNPALRRTIATALADADGVRMVDRLPYPDMVGLLHAAHLVVTDSGGLQEETVTLGVPLLVSRTVTERPEALTSGLGELVGTDPDTIVTAALRRIAQARANRQPFPSPFGDGHAGPRAARAIVHLLGQPSAPPMSVPAPATSRSGLSAAAATAAT